jgi:uncharacterized protein
MKYFICSDIHGSAGACQKIVAQFEALKCDELILLGDILYHGPRNPLPDKYDPKIVAGLLNPLADRIIACRGNCDSEVDQMILSFPIGADYTLTVDNGVRIFASHGHIYSPADEQGIPLVPESRQPPLSGTALELFGHIHIQMLFKNSSGITVCNPGSVSLPKNGSQAGFAVYENKQIALYSMDGNELKSMEI